MVWSAFAYSQLQIRVSRMHLQDYPPLHCVLQSLPVLQHLSARSMLVMAQMRVPPQTHARSERATTFYIARVFLGSFLDLGSQHDQSEQPRWGVATRSSQSRTT